MQHSITVHGAKAADTTGLKRIPSTPEGIAFGKVPGKVAYHDPDYADASLGWARERVDNTKSPFDGVITELANGQKVFGSADETQATRIDFNAEVDPNRWTSICVGFPRERPASVTPLMLMEYQNTVGEGNLALLLSIEQVNFNNYQLLEDTRTGGVRISYNGGFGARTSLSILMTTFSVERGLKMYDGGELVASNDDDKRPLELTDGVYNLYRNGRGQFGPSFLLNTDLSDPENAGFKRAIEKFLMDKYSIPEGPQ